MVTFEAGPDADNSITVQFTLTDDDVALEAIESYIGSLDIVGNPEGVILGMIDTTIVNVRDDDGELIINPIIIFVHNHIIPLPHHTHTHHPSHTHTHYTHSPTTHIRIIPLTHTQLSR